MKFDFKIITSYHFVPTDIHLITPASKEEIENGEYLDVNGIKISSNPKKHAIIKNVKI